MPNKHDGKSYRRLMRRPDGLAIYAAWILIVQVASKCRPRGVLADDTGPLTADDLAIKTDGPAETFATAMEVLSSPDIGWLEALSLEDARARYSGLCGRYSALPIRTDERTDRQTNEHKVDSIESNRSKGDPTASTKDGEAAPEHERPVDWSKANAVLKAITSRVRFDPSDKLPRRVALAVASGIIPENFAIDPAEGVRIKNPRKPGGYYSSSLKEKCGVRTFERIGRLKLPESWPTGPPSSPLADAAAKIGRAAE